MIGPVRYGYCHCGCGQETRVAPVTDRGRGWVRGEPIRFVLGHNTRGRDLGRKEKRLNAGGYVLLYLPDHPNADVNGYVTEHVVVASAALGKPIPAGAVIHHINGVRDDNRRENLLICPSVSYHRLLHVRQDAYDACGNPGWRRCTHCRRHDDPARMHVIDTDRSSVAFHRECRASYREENREKIAAYNRAHRRRKKARIAALEELRAAVRHGGEPTAAQKLARRLVG